MVKVRLTLNVSFVASPVRSTDVSFTKAFVDEDSLSLGRLTIIS